MIFGCGRRAAPGESDAVVTSLEVIELGLPVTRIVRWREIWMFLSGFESDTSQPVEAHFEHLVAREPGLRSVLLKPDEYALRGARGPLLGPWKTYGPFPDRHIESLIDDETMVFQQEGLTRDIP